MDLPPPIEPNSAYPTNGYKKKSSPYLLIIAGIAIFGFCGIGILAAILFPVFSQARVSAKRSLAMSGMKQMAVGMLIYVSDNDDKFPDPMITSEFVKITDQYAQSINPEAKTMILKGPFGVNEELSGVRVTTVEKPETVWMMEFYNSEIGAGEVTGYVDGSVKFNKTR